MGFFSKKQPKEVVVEQTAPINPYYNEQNGTFNFNFGENKGFSITLKPIIDKKISDNAVYFQIRFLPPNPTAVSTRFYCEKFKNFENVILGVNLNEMIQNPKLCEHLFKGLLSEENILQTRATLFEGKVFEGVDSNQTLRKGIYLGSVQEVAGGYLDVDDEEIINNINVQQETKNVLENYKKSKIANDQFKTEQEKKKIKNCMQQIEAKKQELLELEKMLANYKKNTPSLFDEVLKEQSLTFPTNDSEYAVIRENEDLGNANNYTEEEAHKFGGRR